MNERRVTVRRKGVSMVPQIEGLIWLIIGAGAGVMFPIGTDQLMSYLAGSSTNSDHSVIPFILVAIFAGYYGGQSIATLRQNRHAGWIAPLIGFNMTFVAYLSLGVAFTSNEVYAATLIIFGLFLVIRGGAAIVEIFGEPKQHPARVQD